MWNKMFYFSLSSEKTTINRRYIPWNHTHIIDQRPFTHVTMWIPTNHNHKRLLTSEFLTIHIHFTSLSKSIYCNIIGTNIYNCHDFVWSFKSTSGIRRKRYMWMVLPITKARKKHVHDQEIGKSRKQEKKRKALPSMFLVLAHIPKTSLLSSLENEKRWNV